MDELNINEIKDTKDSSNYANSDYTYLSELESFRDRENRSILKICSVYPEQFLSKNIAHPDEVKHLTIILDFISSGNSYTYYAWYRRGSDDLCSDIVNFQNLETLTAKDLNLSEDLWIKFANNSKNLKEIHFSSSDAEADGFKFYEKEKAIEAIFKIPTLEKVSIEYLCFPYLPPGPSNINYLDLYVNGEDSNHMEKDNPYFKQIKSYSNNLLTHTNIKTLILDIVSISPYELKDLKLDKMIQLEEVNLRRCCYISEIQKILMLPNLKKIHFHIHTDRKDPLMKKFKEKNVIRSDLKFPSVEEIYIYTPYMSIYEEDFNFDETKKYLVDIFTQQCLNLKKIMFKNEQIF
jgi:hypothetical protein